MQYLSGHWHSVSEECETDRDKERERKKERGRSWATTTNNNIIIITHHSNNHIKTLGQSRSTLVYCLGLGGCVCVCVLAVTRTPAQHLSLRREHTFVFCDDNL